MTKNTLLAVISIACTFLVIIVLIYLYIQHDGYHEKHSDIEEFILEFAILVDIVSNFICILLSYQFFDNEYNRFCKCCNKRLHKCLHIEMNKQIKKLQSKKVLHVSSQSPDSIQYHYDDDTQTKETQTKDIESQEIEI